MRQAHLYAIAVEGELDDRYSIVFEGMTLHRGDGSTTFEGPVRDQAELQGLIDRVADHGLELISVTRLDREGSS